MILGLVCIALVLTYPSTAYAAAAVGFAAAAIVGVTVTAATATLIGTVIIAGVSVGVAYLTQSSNKPRTIGARQFQPTSSIDEGQKITTQQPIPRRRMVFGRVEVSGPQFFLQVLEPYLVMGILISDGPISNIFKLTIGDRDAEFLSDFSTSTPEWQDPLGNLIEASFRFGSDDQVADPLITQTFSEVPSTFRQRGVATVVAKMHWGHTRTQHDDLYGVGLNITADVEGLRIYDPRDPNQVLTDVSTHLYSNNAALVFLHWLLNRWKNPVPATLINWEQFISAADICDELIPRVGKAPERRYTINGTVSSEESNQEAANKMLGAMAGRLTESNGLIGVIPGYRRDAVATLTDDDFPGVINYRHSTPIDNLVNRVRTTFVSGDRDFTLQNGPVYEVQEFIDSQGEVREVTLDLPLVTSVTQVQRLSKSALYDLRSQSAISSSFGDIVEILEPGDVFNLESERRPHLNGMYQLVSLTPNADNVTAEMEAYDPTQFDWDAATDELPFTLDEIFEAA